jgi:hypothetical protein
MFLKSSLQILEEVRTKRQQMQTNRSHPMLAQIKTVLRRSQATLIQDAMGGAALVVMLVASLHLPVLS